MKSAALITPAENAAVPAPRALIDYDFQSILAAPPRQRYVLWLMVALILCGTIALSMAKVDVLIVTNGKLVTTADDILIQPLETSIVRSVAVKMGDRVKKGQVLARLDPTFTGADEAEIAARLRRLDATYNRLATEIAGRSYDPTNPNPDEMTQRDLFRKRKEEYSARIAAFDDKIQQYSADLATHLIDARGLAKQIRLAGQAERIYHALVAKNLASKLKLIETTQRRIEAESRLSTNQGEQQRLAASIGEAKAERLAFVDGWQRKLAEEMAKTRSDRDAAAAQLDKAKRRNQLSVLRAPRDAVVLEVAQRTTGAVLRPAEPLMRLVPIDVPLVAVVDVRTRDVARLRVGDPVTIKFEALPWQQFGLARGVLKTLTPDTIEDGRTPQDTQDVTAPEIKSQLRQSPIHYRASIALTKTKFRNVPKDFALRPGMRLVADIRIGRRSILQYVLNPLTRVVSSSLREP